MSLRCLMLETSEKKRFFTNLGCRRRLEEYCRTFGTKMYVVSADMKKSQLLGLPELVAALCGRRDGQKPAGLRVFGKVEGGRRKAQ